MTFTTLITLIIIGAVIFVGYLVFITRTSGNKKVKSSDTLDLERIEKAKELEKIQKTQPKKISEHLSKNELFQRAVERRKQLLDVNPVAPQRAIENDSQEKEKLNETEFSEEEMPPVPSYATKVKKMSASNNNSEEPKTTIKTEEQEQESFDDTVIEKNDNLFQNIGEAVNTFHEKNNYEMYSEDGIRILEIMKNILCGISDDSLKVYQ